jgi:hypothetical protein
MPKTSHLLLGAAVLAVAYYFLTRTKAVPPTMSTGDAHLRRGNILVAF